MLALRGLPCRGEDRLGQRVAIDEALGQRHARDRSGRLILLEARPRHAAAHNAFDRQHVERLHQQRTVGDLGRRWVCKQLTAEAQRIRPPQRHRRQRRTLAGNRGGEHVVERAHTIRRHHQQTVGRLERLARRNMQIAHLAAVNEVEAGQVHRAAPAAMSVRCWPPSSVIFAMPSYAESRASAMLGPVATTLSTRPPVAIQRPLSTRVAA